MPRSRRACGAGPMRGLVRLQPPCPCLDPRHRLRRGRTGSIRDRVLVLLRRDGIQEPITRVTLLTMPRVFGYVFNPISLYRCYRSDGTLAAMVAEVHNTFGEAPITPSSRRTQARIRVRIKGGPFALNPPRSSTSRLFSMSSETMSYGSWSRKARSRWTSICIRMDDSYSPPTCVAGALPSPRKSGGDVGPPPLAGRYGGASHPRAGTSTVQAKTPPSVRQIRTRECNDNRCAASKPLVSHESEHSEPAARKQNPLQNPARVYPVWHGRKAGPDDYQLICI